MKTYHKRCLWLIMLPLLLLFTNCKSGNSGFDAMGAFEAEEVTISAQTNGEVIALHLEEGQQVVEGELLGVIDTTQLYLQKMALLSSQKGITAQRPDTKRQIAILEEQLATIEKEQARLERLLAADVATQKQLDDLTAKERILKKQISAQRATLGNANASITAQSTTLEIQVAQVEEQISKCYLISPLTGVVLRKYIQKGELAVASRPLFCVANLDTLTLRAYITGNQLAQIKLGDKVSVQTDDGSGSMRSYQGSISWIASKAEFTPKTIQTKDERANQVYAIKVRVPNDGFIKIGMYGQLSFSYE